MTAQTESAASKARQVPPWRAGTLVRQINARYLALFVGTYFLSLVASERLYGSLLVPSPFWLPDAVLLCTLLVAPPKQRWVFVLAIWPIRLVAAGAPAGTPLWFVLSAIANDSLKGIIAVWWLERLLGAPVRLDTLRQYLTFLIIAGLFLPLLSALAAMPGRGAMGNPPWMAGYSWFLGDAVAQTIVTPMLLYWCTRSYRRMNDLMPELTLLLGSLVAVLYFAFVLNQRVYSPLMLYVPAPFLIWAAVRLGPFGTANALGLVALTAMISVARGTGVFANTSPHDAVVSVQLFLLVTAIPLLSLAVLIDERERRMKELEVILDAVPIPILIASDAGCTRVTANQAGYRLYRKPRGANLSPAALHAGGASFRLDHDGIEVPADEWPLQEAVATGRPVLDRVVTMTFEDGTERHLMGNAAPLFGEDGRPRGGVSATLDITDSVRGRAALRESEQRFHLVADTAPVLIWMSDADRLCTFFNAGWLRFTGRSIEEELGNGWTTGVHPDDLSLCLRTYVEAFDARQPFEMQYRLRRFDGEYRWVVHHGVPRFESNGLFRGYIGSCMDVTDQKQQEAQLQDLSFRLIHAQEEERSRLARELHDDFGQRIAVLQVRIRELGTSSPDLSRDMHRQLGSLSLSISQLALVAHQLSHQLHPSTLEYVGVVAALRGLCRELSEPGRITFQFVHRDVPERVSPDARLAIFRIAQEAMRNVIKHSGATAVTVELRGDGELLDLSVTDNGRGFNSQSVSPAKGLGLVSIRERLRPLGGRLSIQSTPGQGTRLQVIVAADVSSPHQRDEEVRTHST